MNERMRSDDLFARAVVAWKARRHDAARRDAEAAWRESMQSRTAALLALIEIECGNLAAAMQWNDRARAIDPDNSVYEVQSARLKDLAGDVEGAFEVLAALCPRIAAAKMPWREFAAAASRAGREDRAVPALLGALQDSLPSKDALLASLELLPARPVHRSVTATQRAVTPVITVVTCSASDERFGAMSQHLARALRGCVQDIIRNADARSLAEGYARGLSHAKGDFVVFAHETSRYSPTTSAIGSRGISNAAISSASRVRRSRAGPHGRMRDIRSCAGSRSIRATPVIASACTAMSRRSRSASNSSTAFCSQRETPRHGESDGIRSSASASTGTTSISRCAVKAGLRLGVASDLGVVHRSLGQFNDAWQQVAQRLVEHHAELRGARSTDTAFVARDVPDAASALGLVDRWCLACEGRTEDALAR